MQIMGMGDGCFMVATISDHQRSFQLVCVEKYNKTIQIPKRATPFDSVDVRFMVATRSDLHGWLH